MASSSKPAHVLVTGGAGYIGSHTTLELLAAGMRVTILDNLCNSRVESFERIQELSGKPENVRLHLVDLCDNVSLRKIFQAHADKSDGFDACIHFAALKAVGESVKFPLKYYKNNLSGTLNLLELMSEFNCQTVVFSSSATVYGTSRSPLSEDSITGIGITNPYGQTKHMMEQVLRDLQKSSPAFKVVLLRYFNPVGAHGSGRIGEDPKGIPNNLMPYVQQVAVGRRPYLSVFGNDYDTVDGTGVRDYIHVVDLAKGHMSALRWAETQAGGFCEVFNLGTGCGSSVLQVVKSMEKACGHEVPYKMSPRREGDLATVYANPIKAKAVLKWEAGRTMDVMCADSWRWQSSNPTGFGGSVPSAVDWLEMVRVAKSPKAMMAMEGLAGLKKEGVAAKDKGCSALLTVCRRTVLRDVWASSSVSRSVPFDEWICGPSSGSATREIASASADPFGRGEIVNHVDLLVEQWRQHAEGKEKGIDADRGTSTESAATVAIAKSDGAASLAKLVALAKGDAAGAAAYSEWLKSRYGQ